eukprot:Nitzschia sp. Nitz4//NODE_464_length_17123_cov_69.824057//544//1359//NITZ4_additional_000061-RA//-1//CDS//3329531909//4407//frame0
MKTPSFADTLHPDKAEAFVATPQVRADLPVAVAVQQDVESEDQEGAVHPSSVSRNQPNGVASDDKLPRGNGCFYLEGLLGCFLAVFAILATFIVELGAAAVFCVAAGVYSFAMMIETSVFFQAILSLVIHTLLLFDSVFLTFSVLVTEIVGYTAWIITSIFSPECCNAGRVWHYYIRKACYLTRWALRSFHSNWRLKRRFPTLDGSSLVIDGHHAVCKQIRSRDHEANDDSTLNDDTFVVPPEEVTPIPCPKVSKGDQAV